MAKIRIGNDRIFMGIVMIPIISNIGIFVILFGLGWFTTTFFIDITLVLNPTLVLLLGVLLTFVPTYLLFDYSRGTIRKYKSWGIFTSGETVNLDLFNRIEIIKKDRTYTRNSQYSTATTRNITFEVCLGVIGTSEQFELKEFLHHAQARAFALEYSKKLDLNIIDRVAEAVQKKEIAKQRRRRRR